MLELIRIAGLSAALSAGAVVAMPPTQPNMQSGKMFTERLGEAATIPAGAHVAEAPGVTADLKSSRLNGPQYRVPETVTVDRRAGFSIVVRAASPEQSRH